MPKFKTDSSIEINAPVDKVLSVLTDFEQWPAWSPWLYMERDAQLDYRGQAGQIGHGYDWRGKLVGAGSMTLTRIHPVEGAAGSDKHTIDMDLVFLKPFKSTAKVGFILEPQGSNEGSNEGGSQGSGSDQTTTVTWQMDSSLPFFMFFMTEMMVAMIRSDYSRGLKMLKDQIETGAIHSSTEVMGVIEAPALEYIGTTHESSMGKLSESMGQAFPAVFQEIENSSLTVAGSPLAIYNRMNIKTQDCTYTAAIPVDSSNADTTVQTGQIIPGKALKVVHTGEYKHLGNAWATAIGNQRHKKLKPSKKQAPYEMYMTDPETTAPKDLITEIYIPLR